MDSKPDPTHIAIFPIKFSIGHIYQNILISISQLQKLPFLSSSFQVFICTLLVFCARSLSLSLRSRVYAIERGKRCHGARSIVGFACSSSSKIGYGQ
ncbi:hypothetical protein AAC387_Pa06g1833 [Persea americana]